MTSKDFRLVAKLLGSTLAAINDGATLNTAVGLAAQLLSRDNPRFDVSRFTNATLSAYHSYERHGEQSAGCAGCDGNDSCRCRS